MSGQQFGDVGQVQITTHGNIVNEREHQEMSEQRREARMQDLVQRQLDHIAARDAADRRLRLSPYRWVVVLGLLSISATGIYEFQHSGSAHWLFPIQGMMLGVVGAASLMFEHVKRDCRASWRHHNDAVKEINKVLHVI